MTDPLTDPLSDPLSDRIEIRGLRAYGTHGVFEEERALGQTFLVDVFLDLDLGAAAASDELADTVDYGTLASEVADAVEQTRFDLIEALAAHIAGLALQRAGVAAVEVRVAKPEVNLDVEVAEVAVRLRRTQGS